MTNIVRPANFMLELRLRPTYRRALAAAIACLALLIPARASAQSPQLRLDQLDYLAAKAKENVNVSLDPSALKLAGSFLTNAKGNNGSQGLMDIVAGLKGVYVRNFEFEKDGVYTEKDLASVKSQLGAPWTKLISTQNQTNHESVDVYMWPENGVAGGMAIVVAEPKELTVVNIVGRIDLAQLASLGGSFGIPAGLGALGIPGKAPQKQE